MSVEHLFHCDGPGCETNIRTQADEPGGGFITATERSGYSHEPDRTMHFCGWDCCMKFASTFEPPERIDLDAA